MLNRQRKLEMNEKTVRALLDANAVRKVCIVGRGPKFHVDLVTNTNTHTLCTNRGTIRNWSSLDAAAKWARMQGIGKIDVDITGWEPAQKGLPLTPKNIENKQPTREPELSAQFDF